MDSRAAHAFVNVQVCTRTRNACVTLQLHTIHDGPQKAFFSLFLTRGVTDKENWYVIAGREKVGVAGRTGCGKSTLMMALKRVMEPSGGRILIDGVDIAAVPLFDLRSRLALVPQVCLIYSSLPAWASQWVQGSSARILP